MPRGFLADDVGFPACVDQNNVRRPIAAVRLPANVELFLQQADSLPECCFQVRQISLYRLETVIDTDRLSVSLLSRDEPIQLCRSHVDACRNPNSLRWDLPASIVALAVHDRPEVQRFDGLLLRLCRQCPRPLQQLPLAVVRVDLSLSSPFISPDNCRGHKRIGGCGIPKPHCFCSLHVACDDARGINVLPTVPEFRTLKHLPPLCIIEQPPA
jgi:hypothetical protein